MWPRTKSLIRRAWPNTAATLEVLAGAGAALVVSFAVALVFIAHVSVPGAHPYRAHFPTDYVGASQPTY